MPYTDAMTLVSDLDIPSEFWGRELVTEGKIGAPVRFLQEAASTGPLGPCPFSPPLGPAEGNWFAL